MKNSNKRDFYKIYVSEDNELVFTTDLNFKCEDYSKPRLAVIEQGIEYLPDNTFAFCDRLEKVVISECVTEIPNGLFYGSKSLRSVELPPNIDIISSQAFWGCTALEYIVIPEGTQAIGAEVFYGCTSLHTVYIPESLKVISSYAFQGCTSLRNIIGGRGLVKIEDRAFSGCFNLSKFPCTPRIVYLGNNAFDGTGVKIDDKIMKSPKNLYSLPEREETLFVPNNTVVLLNGSIGENKKCIVLPDSVKNISPYAFLPDMIDSSTFANNLEYIAASLPQKMNKPSAFFHYNTVFDYSMAFLLADTVWKDVMNDEDYCMILLYHPDERAKAEARRRLNDAPNHTIRQLYSMIHGDINQMEETAKYAAAYLSDISKRRLNDFKRTAWKLAMDHCIEIIEKEQIRINNLLPEKYGEYRSCFGKDGLEPFFAHEFFKMHDVDIHKLHSVKFVDGTYAHDDLVLSVLYAYTKQVWSGMPGTLFVNRSYEFHICEKADRIAEIFDKQNFQKVINSLIPNCENGIYIPVICRFGDEEQITDIVKDFSDNSEHIYHNYRNLFNAALCLSDTNQSAAAFGKTSL